LADVQLSGLAAGVIAAVAAAMDLDGFTELGVPPRVFTRDTVPDAPQEPYVLADLIDSGFGWDEGLTVGGTSGWVDLQLTGVGRLVQSATWSLDRVRSYLRALDPATVSAGGDTHTRLVSSMGPPSAPIMAGTLWNVAETYNLYVEAS
jgi:hypothetical protein